MTLQLAGQPIGLREISRSGKNTLTAIKRYWLLDTPQKTNIEPKKGGLEDYFPFQLGDFLVPCESSRVYAFLKLLYFEWSPPWHVGWRLSGEGCHWEYDGKNGEFENIDFRFPWLSDTSEMGFGHDVPFLNYSDRLPHPSDLCQPDRVRWG